MTQLHDEILSRAREIKTDGYAMSIGEVLSMYRDSDLEIHPEFQRIFRWSDEQKSRLIESVLLGIPIPSIFVSQRDDGVWDVVDGVQRLSTILQFVGLYEDEEGKRSAPLVLQATEYLPSLSGYRYEADQGPSFDETLRRDFKRSKLDFRIVKKESDRDAKYDLFQRLNSGTDLSPQEARNCLLVMINSAFFEWVVAMSRVEEFDACAAISSRKEDEGFRQELVLRFLMQAEFEGGRQELPQDLGDFITSWMRRVAADRDYDLQDRERSFRRVFALLNGATGDDSFRRWDADRRRFLGAFSISAYETITSGVAASLDAWEAQPDPTTALRERIQGMWRSDEFRENSGTGISPRRRLPRLVHIGRAMFTP